MEDISKMRGPDRRGAYKARCCWWLQGNCVNMDNHIAAWVVQTQDACAECLVWRLTVTTKTQVTDFHRARDITPFVTATPHRATSQLNNQTSSTTVLRRSDVLLLHH